MDSTIEDLKYLECPMNWEMAAIRQQVNIHRLVEKFEEKLEEKLSEQTWKVLNILLFLSYENFKSQGSTFNLINMRHAEEIIQNNICVRKYCIPAQHVLYSSWAHICVKMGFLKSALGHISKVKPFEDMSNKDKAFLLAMKAYFYMMYGPPGNAEAAKYLTEALKLERDEPEWYFLKGKCLARMRRLQYRSYPTKEELAMFRKAAEMNEYCVRYLIHLARSEADWVFILKSNRTSVEDDKVNRSLEADVESLLRKAVQLPVDSPHLVCHIVKSFLKLSIKFRVRNLKLIKFCVQKALEISPSNRMVNHTVGLYHARQGDVEDAVFFLTEASNMGVYGASIDLCRLKWNECRGYNPVPDLMKIVEDEDQFARNEAHGLLATFYLFVKYDLPSAIKHWKQWHHSCDKEGYCTSSLFVGRQSFDLTSVLYDEIRLELDSNSYRDHEERRELLQASVIIQENRPKLQREKPWRQRQHLIDKAQMVTRIGRTFRDSFDYLKRDKRVKRRNQTSGLKEFPKKNIKKVSGCSNRNEKERSKCKKVTRSQSVSRIQEYRKDQKPFWDPEPKRRAGSLDRRHSRKAGSGRVRPDFPRNLLKAKAACVGTLLVLRSYEKNEKFKREGGGSSHNCRSESQESLRNNVSDGRRGASNMGSKTLSSDQVSGAGRKRKESLPPLSRTRSSEQVCERGRSADRRVQNSSQTHVIEPPRSWRSKMNVGEVPAPPKSSFFQSFNNKNTGDRPASRSSSAGAEGITIHRSRNDDSRRPFLRSSFQEGYARSTSLQSKNTENQNDSCRPSSHSFSADLEDIPTFRSRTDKESFRPFSREQKEAPRSSFIQSPNNSDQSLSTTHTSGQEDSQHRSGGRESHTPRGGSFSRGNRRDPGGRRLTESRDAFCDSFKRLNMR